MCIRPHSFALNNLCTCTHVSKSTRLVKIQVRQCISPYISTQLYETLAGFNLPCTHSIVERCALPHVLVIYRCARLDEQVETRRVQALSECGKDVWVIRICKNARVCERVYWVRDCKRGVDCLFLRDHFVGKSALRSICR